MRYRKLMLERKALGDDESDAHETLLATMAEEGLEHYEYKGLMADIDSKKKAKVRMKGDSEAKEE